MKRIVPIFVLLFLALIASDSFAQKKASPAASASGEIDGVNVSIDYHQPSAKGREIMGGLVPFGKVWRTGANDATTIEFSEDVKIEGEDLAAGKYSLFTIPDKDSWTIIFNKVAKQWGAYDYNEAEDALRVTVKPSKTDSFVETFTIAVEESHVHMSWENTAVSFEVSK